MVRTSLPTVALMHPTQIAGPFRREGWVFEEKVDGYRMVAYKDRRAVKLVSRQGVDHTARFPDIVAAVRALEVPSLILDGEIAIFDQTLVTEIIAAAVKNKASTAPGLPYSEDHPEGHTYLVAAHRLLVRDGFLRHLGGHRRMRARLSPSQHRSRRRGKSVEIRGTSQGQSGGLLAAPLAAQAQKSEKLAHVAFPASVQLRAHRNWRR
jgi:ATP dependent DNA ligase domain